MLIMKYAIKLIIGIIAIYTLIVVIQKKGEKKEKNSNGEGEDVSEIAERMGKACKRDF